MERKIEQLYDEIQLPPQIRAAVEEELQGVIAREKEKYDLEIDGLLGRRRELEHKSEKLLEAHYNDAIPLELLKSEQERITKELASINYEIKQHDVTFEQISQNLTNALELLEDVATFYRNGSDIVKRMLNQAIFEKIYISCSKEIPLEIEAEYRPPFNAIVEPFKEELARLNRSIRLNREAAEARIKETKNRILKQIRCGLSACDKHTDIESHSNSNFFTYKSSSKAFLVGLLSHYSNFVPRLISMRPDFLNPSNSNAFVQVITEFTDISYDPDCIIVEIRQQQKDLTNDEIKQVAQRYSEGASIYELADEFGCHRSTISGALKANGIQVSSRLSDRPGLVKQVVRMYSRGRKTKYIAAETGISVTSVRKILHANGFDLKKSSPQRP